jgi:hypothetical protein
VGAAQVTYEALVSRISQVFDHKSGTIDEMKTGEYGYVTLCSLKLMKDGEEKMTDLVAVAIRRERS